MVHSQVQEATVLPVPKFFTEEELAHYLSVDVDFLRQLRDQGEGPVFCDQHESIRYGQKELEDWLDFRQAVTDLTYALTGAFSIPDLAAKLLSRNTREEAIDELVTFIVKKTRSLS